jgi:hypothetical protein
LAACAPADDAQLRPIGRNQKAAIQPVHAMPKRSPLGGSKSGAQVASVLRAQVAPGAHGVSGIRVSGQESPTMIGALPPKRGPPDTCFWAGILPAQVHVVIIGHVPYVFLGRNDSN